MCSIDKLITIIITDISAINSIVNTIARYVKLKV